MNPPMKPRTPVARPIATAVALALCGPLHAASFVYEGRLDDGDQAANGRYDLRLSPYADAKSGAALGAPIVFEDVPVVDGRFRVDFELPLVSAASAWIEVGVRDGAAVGAFSTIPGRSEAASAKAIGACWSSTGDSATNPSVNFLGTTDAQPLVLRVQNQQVVRFEPSTVLFNGAPVTANVIAGSPLNGVFVGVKGATIAGGGAPEDSDPSVTGEAPNRINDDFGTIGGGYANLAGDQLIGVQSARGATVGGGLQNAAGASFATVAGGSTNTASGAAGTVGGGQLNEALADFSTVGGGFSNVASGSRSVIAGGDDNSATGDRATVAGGESNQAIGSLTAVGGGLDNIASGQLATISGGAENVASLDFAAVGGGAYNRATGNSSTIGGGLFNEATSTHATVGGGEQNVAVSPNATVPGGTENCAGGAASFAAGRGARVRRGTGSAVPALGPCAELPSSGDADGDNGTFVWSSTGPFTSTGPNQFLINAPGGASINVNDPAGSTLRVAGTLRVDTLGSSGSTSLCRNASNQISGCSSSARYKEHITDLALGLAVIQRMRPVAYDWKETHEADIGFVAEEIAAIDPRLVTRNAAGEIEGVKYERLTAVLAVALKDLDARLEAIERQIGVGRGEKP